jgi:hypothetical protein
MSTNLNVPHFFCELGLKMLDRQLWQLLHVEKDDQVIRLGKKTITKSSGKHFFRGNHFFEKQVKLVTNYGFSTFTPSKCWRQGYQKVRILMN